MNRKQEDDAPNPIQPPCIPFVSIDTLETIAKNSKKKII
jgi:hypothetical protein